MLYFLILNIFSFANTSYASEVEDFLADPSQIEPMVALRNSGCHSYGHDTDKCPTELRYFHSEVKGRLLYSVFNNLNSPFEKCEISKNVSPVSISKYNKSLGQSFSQSTYDPLPGILSCHQVRRKPLRIIKEENKDLALIYHYRVKQLSQNSKQTLKAVRKIDSMLGQKYGMNKVECENNISYEHYDFCKKIKSCKRSENEIDQMVNLTYSTLEQINKLNKELEKHKKTLKSLNQEQRSYGDLRYSPKLEILAKRAGLIAKLIREIEETINDLETITPWLKGTHFNGIDKKFSKHLIAKDDNNLANSFFKQELRTKFLRQMHKTRSNLLKRNAKITEASNCLNGHNDCKRYKEIKLSLSPVATESIPPEHKNDIEFVQCLDKENMVASNINQAALTTGEVVAGLMIGGAGGVVKLAVTAGRIYQRGNRIKGAVSTMLLTTGGASTYHQYKDVLKVCQTASQNLTPMGSDTSLTCQSKKTVSSYSDYTQCIKQMTTLIVTSGLALKGQKLLSRAPLSNKNSLNLATAGVRGSSKNLNELNLLVSKFPKKESETFQKIIAKNFKSGASVDAPDINYLAKFASSLSKKKRREFLNDYLKNKSTHLTEKFKTLNKKNIKEQKKLELTLYNKYKKKMNEKDAKKKAKADSIARQNKIRQTRMGCRSKAITPEHIRAGNMFGKITVALGVSSTALGFASANFNKDKNAEWYSQLGYETVMAYLFSKIGAKIIKNPSTSLVGKYVRGNVNTAALRSIDIALYSQFYDITESEAQDKLNLIKQDPNKQKALKELDYYIDDNSLIQSIQSSIINNYRGILEAQKDFSELGKGMVVIGDETFENGITKEDLDSPVFQEKLVRATLKEMYNKERGYLNFGSKGLDRFMYDTTYNAAIGVPKAMLLSLPIYYSLCMSQVYPAKGLSAAIGLQAFNQVLSGQFYYINRAKYINQ